MLLESSEQARFAPGVRTRGANGIWLGVGTELKRGGWDGRRMKAPAKSEGT